MTPAERLRFEHLTDATRPQRGLTPTVDDVRVLLKEVERLEHANAQLQQQREKLDTALDAALWAASDAAFSRLVPKRGPS